MSWNLAKIQIAVPVASHQFLSLLRLSNFWNNLPNFISRLQEMSGFGVAPATYISSAGWNTSVQYSRLKSIYVNIANKNDTLSHGIERCLHTSCTSSQSVSARQGVFLESSVQFLINTPWTLYPFCKQWLMTKDELSAAVVRLPCLSRHLLTWRRRLRVRKTN